MKLEKEKQFVVTDTAVAEILAQYGHELKTVNPASSGIENTTLVVTTNTTTLVVRIYRQNKKPVLEIALELEFMDYLHSKGIKVPMVIQNIHKQSITELEWGGKSWHVIVMEYIPGGHASGYSTELLTDMAQYQARMHIASGHYPTPSNAPSIEPVLQERYFVPLINRSKISEPNILSFLERAENYKVALNSNLSSGLCHLDYDKDNIISDGKSVRAILDFDDLAYAPFVVCLGYTVWDIWRYAGITMAKEYLRLYESLRSLDDSEKQILSAIILFRHYVVSSLKILNGHTTKADAISYVKLEQDILKADINLE